MVTKQYAVVHDTDLSLFTKECAEKLSQNWECLGGVAVRDREFLQSFCREIETQPLTESIIKRQKKATRPKAK